MRYRSMSATASPFVAWSKPMVTATVRWSARTPTIWEPWHIEALERAARKRHGDLPSHRLPVHLKLDTGMNRLGAAKEALPHLCEMLSACKHLTLEGVSTHFASAEVLDAEDAVRQMKRFEEGLAVLRNYGLRPPLIHMGNSAAMSARPETWKTMVRPGIALYGYSLAFTRGGEPAAVADLALRPVLSWKTRVLTVKEVAAGQAVGYMGTFVTQARSRIAVLPVGYADESRAGNCGRRVRAGCRTRLDGPDHRGREPHSRCCGGR